MSNAPVSINLSEALDDATAVQEKLVASIKAAKDAKFLAESHNATQRAVANRLVSEIQKNLQKQIVDTQKAQDEAYKSKMVELGLSAEVYPMETAVKAVDANIVTPALAVTGLGFGKVANMAKGIGHRFGLGFKAATR